MLEVSDRFHLNPLLRAVTFPRVAFVLALAQGSVPVIEVLPDTDEPTEVHTPRLPKNVSAYPRTPPVSRIEPRRRIGRRRAGSRAPKESRSACASTRCRSTALCGRC